MDLKIGHHISITQGFLKMIEEARVMGMNCFSCMIGNPRTGNFSPRSKVEIDALNAALDNEIIHNFVVHSPYVFNLASKNEQVRSRTIEDMKKVIPYLDSIDRTYYVLHPGSHTGNGVDKGIQLIVDGLNEIIKENQKTIILLETMAGKGTEIGTLEHLEKIISKLDNPQKVGICFDTCHTWDAGYNLANFFDVIAELHKRSLFEKVRLIHFNDSKNACGSHKDRHENIGAGLIGSDNLKNILNYAGFQDLPFILETNQDDRSRVIEEIKMLKEWRNESSD